MEATIVTHHDNFAMVLLNQKGSATTNGPVASLLRLHALHSQHYQHIPWHDFIPGQLNAMVNKALHSQHLTDAALLTFLILIFHSCSLASYAIPTPGQFLR